MPRVIRASRAAPIIAVAAALFAALVGGGHPGSAAAAVSPTPPVTTGLQLWFEADTLTSSDGQSVATWPDKSGFARDLTAQPGSAAPMMRRAVVNGRAALEFNGTSSLLKTYTSTFSLAQPTTFFIVYRSLDANTSTHAFVFDSRNSSVRQVFGRPATGQIRMYANLDMDFGGETYPFSSFHVFSGTFNGNNSSLYDNGVLLGNGKTGTSALSGFTVGGLSTSGNFGYDYSHVQIAEILYYSGALSSTDRVAVTDWLNQKYTSATPPVPPSNSALPSISGTPADGSTLTASSGTWDGTTPLSYAYQWQRCASTCSAIGGATSATYQATPDDVGSRLAVTVTASNTAGNASATSAQTAIVAAAPPSNTGLPVITGTPRSGSTLTTTNGAWNGTPPLNYTYRWERCDATPTCSAIQGAPSSSTYTLTDADIGSTIRVVVTASNTGGSASSTSARTNVIVSSTADQPPVSAGLALWYDANANAYADGARVTRWVDESGFGRDLTAFDTNSAPVYRQGAVNGRAAVEFDGTSSLMKTYESTFTLSQPTTFFVVYRSLDADTSARAFVFDSTNSSTRQVFGRASAGGERLYANVDLDFPGFTYPFPSFAIFGGTFNGSSSSLYRNGTLVGTGNAGGSAISGFTLGGLSSGAQYGYDMSHVQVAEILYYNGALSASDRQAVTDWLNQRYALITPPSPPSNQTAPSITGNATDGATLTAATGTWNGSTPITYTYRWRRCDSSGGSCSDTSATGSTYTLSGADIGSTMKVTVTATNSVGNASADSAPTAVVTASPPVNQTAPSISGTAREGSTLTASDGTWTGSAPIVYQRVWQRCDTGGGACNAIAGAAGTTYQVAHDDVGSTLRVLVTASNGVGVASKQSDPTATVLAAGDTSLPPVLTGLQLWYDAGRESYADGAPMMSWTDRSGFNRTLTAFDSGAAPTYRANAINGRPAVEFDGARSLMKTYGSTFTLSQPTTFFIVFRQFDGGEAYIFDSTNSSVRQLLGRGPFNDMEMYANIDLVDTSVTWPFPSFEVWSGTMNDTSSSLWRNGVLRASGAAGTSGMSGFALGALSTSAQYGYLYSHSLVAEVLYYTGAMTDADRGAVTSWLNQKYALF